MFTYKHAQFDGLDGFYISEILPELEPIERARQAFWPKFYRISAFLLIVIVIATGVLFQRFSHPFILLFGVLIAMGTVVGYYTSASASVRGDTKHILMARICGFIGFTYAQKDEANLPALDYWQNLHLLPARIDRTHFEDFIRGHIQETNMNVCEAKLERKVKTDKGHRWDTVFRGSLITLDFHREFLGTTIVLRDAGIFNAKKKNNMKRIGLGEPRFEKIFEAYGTDQVEGRYLLTPVFMETLVALEESVEGNRIRFAFSNGKLLIAVEHADRFEVTGLLQSITDPARVQTVVNEIEAILSIIKSVAAPKRRR